MSQLDTLTWEGKKIAEISLDGLSIPLDEKRPRIEYLPNMIEVTNFDLMENADNMLSFVEQGGMPIAFREKVFSKLQSANYFLRDCHISPSFADLEFPVLRLGRGLFMGSRNAEKFPEKFPELEDGQQLYEWCGKAKQVCVFFPKATNIMLMYGKCTVLGPDITVRVPVAVNASALFDMCPSLIRATIISPVAQNLNGAAANCPVLEELHIEHGGGPCTISVLCYDDISLHSVEINTVGISSARGAFQNTPNLKNLPLSWPALTEGTDAFRDSGLSAAQIDSILTSLPARTNHPVITFTGCPGAPGCDPSIATAKGWTVQI